MKYVYIICHGQTVRVIDHVCQGCGKRLPWVVA